MPLQLYRRHGKECPAEEWDKTYRRCKCPILAEGMLNGKWVRKSTRRTTWEEAEELVERWEQEGQTTNLNPFEDNPTLDHALTRWEQEWVDRNFTSGTKQKYRTVKTQLDTFSEQRGLIYLNQFTTDLCREFRQTWKDGAYSASKKLKTFKLFFKFCVENNWLPSNPALPIKPPKVILTPTLPFTQEEFCTLLLGTNTFSDKITVNQRLKAFILVMRWSGLRAGDAVSLTTDRIIDDRLFLYTQKTGVPVWIPLPPQVLTTLSSLPPLPGGFFFWPHRKLSSQVVGMVTNYGNKLKRLGEKTGIPGVRSHRFRDTFAVELLQLGVPIEDVSILLGHTSIATTEKHYAPWVKGRQDRLEKAVRLTWD